MTSCQRRTAQLASVFSKNQSNRAMDDLFGTNGSTGVPFLGPQITSILFSQVVIAQII